MAIMFPLRPRMSKMSTLVITFIIWFCSSVLALPNLLYSTGKVTLLLNGGERSICYWEWPDGSTGSSYLEYVYNVMIFVLTYVLPMGAIAYSYVRISHELWGSQSIGECTPRQVESVKNKRKVVKMMILVVIIFAICWFPYHIYFIIIYYEPTINELPNIQHYYLLIYWLAMSNSMYNPMIYCWMNSRFREGFRAVFSCLLCSSSVSEDDLKVRKLQYNYGGGSRSENRNARYSCFQSADGLVHISLHTLTDMVGGEPETATSTANMVNNSAVNRCSRPKLLPAFFIRKIRTKKPSAV
ncbi:Tachykinin receptor [Chamberlinius hualienensis]